MLELLIGIGVGCGSAVLGAFYGQVMGYHRGKTEKDITALFITGQAEHLWCTCGHSMSMHRDGKGGCKQQIQDVNPVELRAFSWNSDKDSYLKSLRCSCQLFVGDPTRNPPPAIETPKRGELEL